MAQPNLEKHVRDVMGDLLMQIAQLKAVNEALAADLKAAEEKLPPPQEPA